MKLASTRFRIPRISTITFPRLKFYSVGRGNDRFLAAQTSRGSRKRGDASGTGSHPLPPFIIRSTRVFERRQLSPSLSFSLSLSTGNKKSGERVLSRVCLIVIAVSSGHERKNRAIVRGAPVTSLPRGGARITHVFVWRWGGGGGGGERKHFFRKWTPA